MLRFVRCVKHTTISRESIFETRFADSRTFRWQRTRSLGKSSIEIVDEFKNYRGKPLSMESFDTISRNEPISSDERALYKRTLKFRPDFCLLLKRLTSSNRNNLARFYTLMRLAGESARVCLTIFLRRIALKFYERSQTRSNLECFSVNQLIFLRRD